MIEQAPGYGSTIGAQAPNSQKKTPAVYATQYFVDDVRLRRTFDLDIGNNQVRMLRYEDGGTNVQAISREYGL
jgi:hypothetical protein